MATQRIELPIIEEGDIVDVIFTNNPISRMTVPYRIRCELISYPKGMGDTISLSRLDTPKREGLEINGNSSNFIGLEFKRRPHE